MTLPDRTDSLRDRIAAACQAADQRLAVKDEMPIGVYYAALADAVIAELGESDNPQPLNRTDSLRDRIAGLQRFHIPVDYAGYIECSCGTECKPDHGGIDVAEQMWGEHVADAVIAELDMGSPCITTGCRMRQIARRHAEANSRLEIDDD